MINNNNIVTDCEHIFLQFARLRRISTPLQDPRFCSLLMFGTFFFHEFGFDVRIDREVGCFTHLTQNVFVSYSIFLMMTNQISKTRRRPRRQRQNAVLNLENLWGPYHEENGEQLCQEYQDGVNVATQELVIGVNQNSRLGYIILKLSTKNQSAQLRQT
jgi:hypothetical protein